MKTGIVTDDFYPWVGGMGRHVYELSIRMPPEQFYIFSPCNNNLKNHIRLTPAFHKKGKNLALSFWLNRNTDRIITEYNLSKLNIHCGPGGLFLLRDIGIPVIATCHHTYWQQSHYIRSQLWKKFFVPLEKQTYQLADKIICVSQDTRDILVRYYHIPSKKMLVIPNGIDTSIFFPIPGIKKIPNSLLFVGRLDKRKGIDFLAEAMPFVKEKIKTAKLYIGGTGKYESKLRQYVIKKNLSDHVEFLGFIPDNELNYWYNRVQCAIIPSVFEGFGFTAAEAMAAGTAVIATNTDGLKSIVKDNTNGFLVRYGAVNELSDKIIFMLNDRETRKRFEKKGREMIVSNYDWNILAEKVAKELFDKV